MASWLAHGTSSSGFILANRQAESKTVPAVANHRGRLWCLWADFEDRIWCAVTDDSGEFAARVSFPIKGLPVIANLNGILHVVVVLEDGRLVHYRYDDDDRMAWECLGPLGDASNGIVAHSTPALVAFHNKLFLVYLRDGQLFWMAWSVFTQQWTAPVPVVGDEKEFGGIPALFVIESALHMLCGSAAGDHAILGYRFDYVSGAWSQCDDVSEGKAARGVSAASYGASAYLGFVEDDGAGDQTRAVYVAAYQGGRWQPQEAVDGQSAASPPQIAILNGRIHCIFNDNTKTRDLRWYSRPVLEYSLSSWMGRVPDATPLSQMTVPGTHDSCARSNIPFVRTQFLSISQLLALGIRFFDLRLRRHADGRLFCYHGGIPIGLPEGLSFAHVMQEIWDFLTPPGSTAPPTETVLVSINNDDTSPEQKAEPAVFYGAVAHAIAATPPLRGAPGSAPMRRWYAEPVTPALGEVRGRAVLLRRFAGDPAVEPAARMGLDLSAWLDDNPDFDIVTPTGVRVRLQDKWKFAERIALHDLVAAKSGFVRDMMAYAADPRPEAGGSEAADWFINFCSAVGDPVEHGEVAEAKWIAVGAHSDFIGRWVSGMNTLTRDHLRNSLGAGRRRLGVVNLDYPELPEDSDLVARLIETNF